MELNKTQKIIGIITGSLVILGVLWGSLVKANEYIAKASDLVTTQKAIQKLGIRLDSLIDMDRLNALQEQNWRIEDRNNTSDPLKMSPSDRETYRKNQVEIERLRKKWDPKPDIE